MKSSKLSGRTRYQTGGFLLLLVLVSLAIGLLILGVSMVSMDPFSAFNGSGADRYADPNAKPWDEGHLFINQALDGYNMGGRREPFSVQPKIEDLTYYDAYLYSGDEPRGTISVQISPDGDVAAVWEGKFTTNGVEYEVQHGNEELYDTSVFKGNIAPLKVYVDQNGEKNYRMLYFITGGDAVAASQAGNRIAGAGYVTGWINKDHTCFGKLWIVAYNRESPEVYQWQAVEPRKR
jgi:hypothetical protein